MIYLILVMVFILFYLIYYLSFGAIYIKRQAINIRLERIAKDDPKTQENELSKPLFARIIQPMLERMSKTVLKIAPKEIILAFEKKVIAAGIPYNLMVKDWINIQVLIILCIPMLTATLGYYIDFEVKKIIIFGIVEVGLGLLIPSFILSKKANERHNKILRSLPDVLDLLTVSVEAGLSFDGALTKVVDKMPGPLAKEFENVLQEMKVGKQKRDALRDMAERTGVNDLTSFVGSIIQADQLGVSIGNVLRIQSEQMRQKRMQRAQEKAMKAPVKMLIPMILFIFPTIFSVLIGPVIVRMINVFFK